MNKKLIFSFMLCLSILGLKAQQLPQFTQYFLNEFAINPATAGMRPYFDARFNNRYQWVGITDAPRTFITTVNGPFLGLNMGIGGKVYADIVGPTRRIGGALAYSYHLKINDDLRLGMGLSAGFLQYAMDGAKIFTKQAGDPYQSSFFQNITVPEIGFGLHLQHKKYFATLSIPQLYKAKTDFFVNVESRGKLEDHYFAGGGYTFDLNADFQIQPTVFIKYVKPTPPIIDLSARVIYQEKVWAGLSYRTRDALSIMFGYIYQDNILIGYSYDYTLSDLVNYNRGTHEIMLGIRFRGNKPEEPKEIIKPAK